MSTVYTARQMRFIHVFMQQTHPQLKSFLRIDTMPSSDSNSAIADGVAQGADALSAAVAVAGLAAAAPTLGASVVGASGCIVLLQTLNGGYQFVKRQLDNQDAPFSPDETQLETTYLSLTILLRQVAYLAAVRYRHFIDEILEEHSVSTFANYVASRAIKHLTIELTKQNHIVTTAEEFLNYFMAKATLPLAHRSAPVLVKDEYLHSGACSPKITHAKLACARPGLAVYDEPFIGNFVLYVSPRSNLFSRDLSTLQEQYGYATVPHSELTSETAAVSRKTLVPLSPETTKRALREKKRHFAVFHQVSRQEVEEYLAKIRDDKQQGVEVESLNQYLSESLESNLIAACNDDRLSGLDLSDGDFSNVWFVGSVDLSDCNLSDTVWTKAHLNGTQFIRNNLSRANFQHAYAEQTIWKDILFTGNFSHVKLNGAKLINSTMSAGFNQFGCDWELVEMENVRKEDVLQLLTLRLDEQLIRQNEERIHLNTQITQLSQQYRACLQDAIQNRVDNENRDKALTTFREQIQTLESRYVHNVSQMDIRLVSIQSQFDRLQKDHLKETEEHHAAMEQRTKRLDKLEHRAFWSAPRRLGELSFFKPKQRPASSAAAEDNRHTSSAAISYL